MPFLLCSTVEPLATGFVELTVAEAGKLHALTLLIPTPHVMCAMHLKQRHQTGFAMPTPQTTSYMERVEGCSQQPGSP